LKAEGISRSTLEDSGASYLGHCWAMSGGHGFITVKLDRPVSPSQFVLEHAPPRISPSAGTSAPNKFRLIGWSGPVNDRAGKGSTTGEEELVSGAYLIDDSNSDSVFPHIQRFDVASAVSFLNPTLKTLNIQRFDVASAVSFLNPTLKTLNIQRFDVASAVSFTLNQPCPWAT
jgi:hypothetical protein